MYISLPFQLQVSHFYQQNLSAQSLQVKTTPKYVPGNLTSKPRMKLLSGAVALTTSLVAIVNARKFELYYYIHSIMGWDEKV